MDAMVEALAKEGLKLATGALAYGCKVFFTQQKDRIRLEAQLQSCSDSSVIRNIGCPGISVMIVSRGERAAKIKDVFLESGMTEQDLQRLEKGFQFPFGQSKNPELPPPRLRVELYRFATPDQKAELVLGRDDAAKFLLPLGIPALPIVLSSPSETVRIGVTLIDETVIYLKQGLQIQEMIHSMLQAHEGMPLSLKTRLKMTVTVSAEEIPQVKDMIDALNPNPICFGEQMLRYKPCSQRAAKCLSASQDLWNHWCATESTVCQIEISNEFDFADIEAAKETRFCVVAGDLRTELNLIELLNTFDLLTLNFTASKEAEPDVDVVEVEVQLRNEYGYTEIEQRLRSLPIVKPQETSPS